MATQPIVASGTIYRYFTTPLDFYYWYLKSFFKNSIQLASKQIENQKIQSLAKLEEDKLKVGVDMLFNSCDNI